MQKFATLSLGLFSVLLSSGCEPDEELDGPDDVNVEEFDPAAIGTIIQGVAGDADNDGIPDEDDCANNNPAFRVHNSDGDNNSRSWVDYVCSYHVGEYLVGVSYKDKSGSNSDHMDGVTAVCRNRCYTAQFGLCRWSHVDLQLHSRRQHFSHLQWRHRLQPASIR